MKSQLIIDAAIAIENLGSATFSIKSDKIQFVTNGVSATLGYRLDVGRANKVLANALNIAIKPVIDQWRQSLKDDIDHELENL